MPFLGLDTTTRRTVFFSYLGLWCSLRLFIYGSKHQNGAPEYNSAALLVFTCILKLLISVVWFVVDEGVRAMTVKIRESGAVFLRYFMPAASYCLYDNLMFFSLSRLDPVTYVILMQVRLIATGIVWQSVFAKQLTRVQWAGLSCVSLACVIQGTTAKSRAAGTSQDLSTVAVGVFAVVLQVACGVFSSIYNEFMLKRRDVSLHLQNVYMYTHSIICNVLWLLATGQQQAVYPSSMAPLLDRHVLPVGLLHALIGIATAIFLKHLDSIRKAVASAIEILIDAILSWVFFGFAVGFGTAAAIILCGVGIMLYSREPSATMASPRTSPVASLLAGVKDSIV